MQNGSGSFPHKYAISWTCIVIIIIEKKSKKKNVRNQIWLYSKNFLENGIRK